MTFGLRCHSGAVVVWLFAIAGLAGPLSAGGGPENVVLVVNENHAGSLMIANHYIAWRKIPALNVVYLDDVPASTVVSLENFQNKILKPVIDAIRARGLAGQIDAIVYSDGFPTAVSIGAHVRKLESQIGGESGPIDLGRMFNPRASITSLTYFAMAVLADDPGYLALDANWYYRGPAGKLLTEPFLGEEQAEYQRGLDAASAEDFDSALDAFSQLHSRHPHQVAVIYQLARTYAAIGDDPLSLHWLARAVQAGWMYRSLVEQDPVFEPLRNDPRFQQLCRQMPEEQLDFAPTHAFRSHYWWSPTGSINSTPDQGRSYLLSTLLAVTSANGNSEQEALDQLRISTAADGTRPNGKFVFALTGDVRTTTRKPQFMSAVNRLRAMGLDAEVTGRVLPQRARIAGLSIGTANFTWQDANSLILPGAICENLTSLGGRFDNPGQTKLTEFLRHGAAGSSGTVIEPFSIPSKFPHAMIHVHYARGCSLAEAYYQSVAGPFQLLIVGDALCQPWARFPLIETPNWTPPASVRGELLIPLALRENSPPVTGVEIFIDGRQVAFTTWPEHMRFDSANLTDGYHELRIVAVGSGPIYTRSRLVVPLWIDNQKTTLELSTEKANFSMTDVIRFAYRASVGNRFELRQGARVLQTTTAPTGTFELAAAKLGRGPVALQLVAIDDQGREYLSQPLAIEIEGPISKVKPPPNPANQAPRRRGRTS